MAEVIRHRLADVLARGDVHDPDLARFSITVSEVTTSPDLKHATAYVMPLGGMGADDALKALRRSSAELRHQVARDLGLKFAPALKFELDGTFDRMDDARRIFNDPRVQQDVAAPEDEPEDGDDDNPRDDAQ